MNNRIYKGKRLCTSLSDYCVVDIETTGLSPAFCKIIEISAIKVRNKEIVSTFSMLINPHTKLDSFIIALTGINDKMLQEAPEIEDVLVQFLSFVGNDIILGHNVNFDINFLYDNILNYLGEYFTNDFIDTMYIARRVLSLPHNRLDDLVKYFNITARDKHRALNDCDLTYKVYLNLEKYL